MRSHVAMDDSCPDDEIRRLHDELAMPVGEFGALAAAALLAFGVLFVGHPLSKAERVQTTALSRDAKSHAGERSRRLAKVHEARFGVFSADALTHGFAIGNDAHSGKHS